MGYCQVVDTSDSGVLTVKLAGKIDSNNHEDIQLEAYDILNSASDDVSIRF